MLVEIWSDVVCPWCYIGKRRFEAALAEVPYAREVEVVWRSYELDPNRPRTARQTNEEVLAAKYGMSREQAVAANQRVTHIAASVGLHYRLDLARPSNSFDAHRLLHLALRTGHQAELKESLLAGYFSEGATISEPVVLSALATRVGMPPDKVTAVLSTDAFAAEVREDEAMAASLGVTGVPFFAFDRHLGVAGAQEVDVFIRALEESWAHAHPS